MNWNSPVSRTHRLHTEVTRGLNRLKRRPKPNRLHRDRTFRAASCEGKTRFGKKHTANKTARRIEAATGKPFTVYRCSFCGCYHIAHVS